MKLPTFLIAGAAKSGTTSVWHYLRQHPGVFMPVNKEPLFMVAPYYERLNRDDPKWELLTRHLVRDFDAYRALFAAAREDQAVGEATQPYLYHYELSIERILRFLGQVKIVILLRNPVERAVSAYTYLLRDGEEPHSLDRCLDLEETRRRAHWSMSHFYLGAGLYHEPVKAYLDAFREVRVYLYEDLCADAPGLVRDLYGFLGVDDAFLPDVTTRHNVSGVPTNAAVHRLLSKPNLLVRAARPLVRALTTERLRRRLVEGVRTRYLEKPAIPEATLGRLRGLFREDLLRLQDLLGRDLSAWL